MENIEQANGNEKHTDAILASVERVTSEYIRSLRPVDPEEIYRFSKEMKAIFESVYAKVENVPDLRLTPSKIKASVTPNYLVCFEDGKHFKSLKRHLRSQYAMTADEYKQKWGLPMDYPMVAPNYAKHRSELARKTGLGFKRKKVVVEAPKKRSRKMPIEI